jgi:hypothetical protein
MRIGKPLAIVIGIFTIWPVIYMALFIVWFIVTALTFFQHTQQHQSAGPPALFQYIFLPHLLTMLLTFVLIAFYIVHVFKNPALKDDRRVLWAVVLFMGGIIAAPVYWWLFIWRPLRGDAAV